jgi:outer membrane protein assembly factor BamB
MAKRVHEWMGLRMWCRLVLGCTFLGLSSLLAADWPQWRGPNRTGISAETDLQTTFPANGPKLLWTFKQAGLGYSAVAVVGKTVYCLGAEESDDTKEFVFAVDATSGKPTWKTPVPKKPSSYKLNANWGGGPRSTPTVDGDKLYVLGVLGDLLCLDTKGKIVWHKNLSSDFGGVVMKIWGYSESPLIDGDKLICCPGGGKGTILALDKATGKEIWRSGDVRDDAAYASVVPATLAGVKQYVAMTAQGVVGVAADTGAKLWSAEVAKNDIAVIPTPVVVEQDNLVYVTSDYGSGGGLIRLSPDGKGVKAEVVYNNKVMQNHHGGVVLLDGHIYGHSGNSTSRGAFTCQKLLTGDKVWDNEDKKLGSLSITLANGHIYGYSQNDGTLVVIKASPDKWEETGRFKIPVETKKRKPQGRIWTHPVISNGKIYLRDQELLYCFDISAKKS